MKLNYKFYFIIIASTLILLLYYYYEATFTEFDINSINTLYIKDKPLLINTSKCRIDNLQPFHQDLKSIIYKVAQYKCNEKPLLSYIATNANNDIFLHINKSLLSSYSSFEINCCYSTIRRNLTADKPDNNIIISECHQIESSIPLKNEDTVRITCWNFLYNVYTNVHAIIKPPPKTSPIKRPNVMIIGLDSISKLNFIRNMPKTYKYCEQNQWASLDGYIKVADNTFPNLMAFLTGMNSSDSDITCPTEKFIDNCTFIWKKFKSYNYTTLFAEDFVDLATFNSAGKMGFLHPPTDYYFRTYFQATETLPISHYCNTKFCTGPESIATRMLNIAADFTRKYRNVSSFSMFWINTISHNSLNCPQIADEELTSFLKQLEVDGVLNDTIIFFLADHGFRYGKIRLTHHGYIEERMPFIYIWLPKLFRQTQKISYENLLNNRDKLTSPYDLYMTFQHILKIVDDNFQEGPSRGCPKCSSLFKPIPETRTCKEAGISNHFCTCSTYHSENPTDPLIQSVANYLMNKINELVLAYEEGHRCAHYELNKIVSAEASDFSDGQKSILIKIRTFPLALFEATINVDMRSGESKYNLLKSISRINQYGPRSYCVANSPVKLYCYCKTYYLSISNVLCNNYYCIL